MAGHLQRTEPSRNFPKGGWEARYRVRDGGRMKWRARTFATKRAAERFLAETVTDIHRGDYIDPTKQQTTFAEVASSWLESRHKLRPKTLAGYRWTLDKHLTPEWGKVKVGTIDFDAVQTWVNRFSKQLSEKTGKQRSPQAVRGSYRVLRMVLGHAVKLKKLRSNPCDRNIELPKATKREMPFLTHTQVNALAEAISVRPPSTEKHYHYVVDHPNLGVLVRFAAYTGLRAGEIAALRVRHLDLTAGTVSVEEAVSDVGGKLVTDQPKTEKGRRVVGIDSWLCDLLKTHLGDRRLQPDAFVFVGHYGGQWRHSNFRGRFWKDAVKRSGLPSNLRFHDLRHTYASFLCEANVHVAEMSRLLGHASVAITIDIYTHILPSQTAGTAAKLGAARAAALEAVS